MLSSLTVFSPRIRLGAPAIPRIGDNVALVFTTVMDELSRGYVDEDEDAEAAPTDRVHWESRGSKATVALADQLLIVLKELDPSLELNYNKLYMGLSRDGQPYNFVTFRLRSHFECGTYNSSITMYKLYGGVSVSFPSGSAK